MPKRVSVIRKPLWFPHIRKVGGRRGLSLIALLVLLTGCQDEGSSPDTTYPAYEKWISYHMQDYTIDQRRICFCGEGGQTMRLVIRSGAIISVIRLSDGIPLDSASSSWYLTVNSLFSIIQHPGHDSLVIQYNGEYGYPEVLDVNPQLHPVDGGVRYETSNLQVP